MKREVLVSLQTAYDLEVEVENNPYDPGLMVFMDYRDYVEQKVQCMEEEYPSFLHAMPMSPTRVLFEETCLASRNAIPFNLLKKKLMPRLKTMGIRVTKVYEEDVEGISWITTIIDGSPSFCCIHVCISTKQSPYGPCKTSSFRSYQR